ncbi:phytoene desaturase family protein [Actinomycetota bacterium]
MESVDAVVIGAGHHGLVAAAVLADAGWDVLVLESADMVGGAVSSIRHGEWVMDRHSSCHPLAMASPVLASLELESHGLRWSHAPRALAQVGAADDPGVALDPDPQVTAAGLDAAHAGDGEAWLGLVQEWTRVREPLLAALLTRWPPVRDVGRLLSRVGPRGAPDLARRALLPITQLGRETFGGSAGRDLLAGNAVHADIPPDSAGSGLFGWLMAMLAQDVGFPSPHGGTSHLAQALSRRAISAGARIETGQRVQRIAVSSGRAVGVETQGGRRVRARRAVIADTSAPALYGDLVPDDAVPAGLRRRMARFEWDLPTVKLNYRLSAPVPWTSPAAHGAGVVHAGHGLPGLVRWSGDLESGRMPSRPFALIGQMTTIDRTRSPEGTEAMWLYTHLPRGVHDDRSATVLAERAEDLLESLAPGFRDLVIDRRDQTPRILSEQDENLGQGAVGGGTQQLFQQAVFRPVLGLGGPRTHIDGLYLGSAATHPGGGVHGGCGNLAARAALRDSRWWGRPAARTSLAALHHLYSR